MADDKVLAALKMETNKAKKQFILEEVSPDQVDIYPEYKFFITIGYSWSNEKDFQDFRQFPEEPGVYRLKAGGEVVRIGESRNIAELLREHLKDYGSEIETFDFEIVPNEAERKQEQKRLMDSFKAAVGRLPRYNPITS